MDGGQKNKMNYIQIDKDNLLNGPGIRTVLWTAGCNHACYKCHNPETWDPEAGQYFTETTMNEILQQVSHDYVTGLTITGGDPLYVNNRETVAKICKTCKDAYPDKTIWCYTGYKYEEVKNEKAMEYIDVLVDGPFIYSLYDSKLNWRGSSNQRIIDVQESRKFGKVVLDKDNN